MERVHVSETDRRRWWCAVSKQAGLQCQAYWATDIIRHSRVEWLSIQQVNKSVSSTGGRSTCQVQSCLLQQLACDVNTEVKLLGWRQLTKRLGATLQVTVGWSVTTISLPHLGLAAISFLLSKHTKHLGLNAAFWQLAKSPNLLQFQQVQVTSTSANSPIKYQHVSAALCHKFD